MKIGIIGSGVVGTATGALFEKFGCHVIYHDISEEKIVALQEKGHTTASSIQDVIQKTDATFVCVNTPTNDGEQDLSSLLEVLSQICLAFNRITNPHLLVFRSTMLPGTMTHTVAEYMEKNCTKVRGRDYDICYNPEFLRQNSAMEDVFNPDRVVLGEDHAGASLPILRLYQRLNTKVIVTSFEGAEMIKYASNCFLSLKISFFNEVGLICSRMGIDSKVVNEAVSLDRRIGKYGTVAGRPFGGPCLPKDSLAWASFAKRMSMTPDLIGVALQINEIMEKISSQSVMIKKGVSVPNS